MRPVGRHWVMAARPEGPVGPAHFELREAPPAELAEGECELAAIFLSIDPTIRLWMSDVDQPAPPIAPGAPVRSFVYGQVVRSRDPTMPEGALAWATGCWAERLAGRGAQPVGPSLGLPLAAHASVLGLPGLTAWFGLTDVGRPLPGDTVLVSAGTGAVGAVAGQVARAMGARTVAVVGTADRAARAIERLGYAAAVVRDAELPRAIRGACPDGIDVVFENVAGATLDAALGALNRGGRVVLCGMIAGYDRAGGWPANQLRPLLMREGRIEGFLISACRSRFEAGRARLAALVHQGRLIWDVDVLHGLEQAPDALMRVLAGRNMGKQLVQLSPDPWSAPEVGA
ncbi:MAG: zinc-binding dehydrogenase [Sphingomonadaceae bacterium]